MQVFKAFFKVVKKLRAVLMIYLVVFTGMSVIFARTDRNHAAYFQNERSKIAVFSKDASSVFYQGFHAYLDSRLEIVEIEDAEKAVQDALMFQRVEYVLRIPEHFYEDFKQGKDLQITKQVIPDSEEEVQIDALINQYFHTAWIYLQADAGIQEAELVQNVRNDLEAQGTVEFLVTEASDNPAARAFFNFLLYTILTLVILGVCNTLFVFFRSGIKARNEASPLKPVFLQMQLVLGNLFYTLLVFGLVMAAGMLLFPDVLFSWAGIFLGMNVLVLCITALSIAFFVSNLVKSLNAVTALTNIIGLCSSFICGAFVPQELLHQKIVFASSFMPGYWFVKVNNDIFGLTEYTASKLAPVFSGMAVQAVFAAAFLTASLFLMKRRKRAFS